MDTRNRNKLPVQSSGTDIDAFLDRARSLARPPTSRGRLLFAMDATMSREATWDRAASLQGDMFAEAAGKLAVQLVWFRGLGEFRAGSWVRNPEQLLPQMTAVSCRAGATQIHRVLEHAAAEHHRERLAAFVYVGDSCEEPPGALRDRAGELGIQGLRGFIFQEGYDPVASVVFRDIARLSGGAHARFDLSSAATLRRLLRAVSAYAAGGPEALADYHRRAGEEVLRIGSS